MLVGKHGGIFVTFLLRYIDLAFGFHVCVHYVLAD